MKIMNICTRRKRDAVIAADLRWHLNDIDVNQ